MQISEEKAELFKAMAAAQGEFTTVEKGKDNPFFKSKYAPLDAIIEMIRPILPKHGLSVIQFTDVPESGNGVIVETIITHSSGQFISGKLLMPLAKVDPQGAGSALTYGRRYGLAAALGIVSDEDVDGNTTPPPTEKKTAPPKQEPPPKTEMTESQAKYFPRCKAALDALYGTDTLAKVAKIEEMTKWEKEDGTVLPGVKDYRKKDGKPLEILCHSLEKLAADKAKENK